VPVRLGSARLFQALTFAVAAFALVLKLVLVWQGSAILVETDPPGRATRLLRFVSYLTIGVGAIMLLMFLLAVAYERRSPRFR
jgi:hypothetical protein